MPETLTGRILLALILVSGMGGGFTAAVMLENVLGDGDVKRRDFVAAAVFSVLLVTSGLLLVWVEGH